MESRLSVHVQCDDPISRAGVASQLRGRPEVRVLESRDQHDADVVIIVVETLDADSECTVREIKRSSCDRVVVVSSEIDDIALLRSVELGVNALLRRSEASPERLAAASVCAARGEGAMAPDLLGRLLGQMSRLDSPMQSPHGLGPRGFTDREVDVLRLLSEGCDTAEIANQLAYSERTIKNVIHDVTSRCHLRNRSHAVAYAMRSGVI